MKRLFLILMVLLAACVLLFVTGCAKGESGGNRLRSRSMGRAGARHLQLHGEPFTDKSGVKVEFEGTRDLDAVLTTRVAAGNPPDRRRTARVPGKWRSSPDRERWSICPASSTWRR